MKNLLRFGAVFAFVPVLGCTAGQQLGNPSDGGSAGDDGGSESSVGESDGTHPGSGDNNPVNDAASAPPPGAKRVFVTSGTHDWSFGGLAGADQWCTLAAEGASLGGKWKALLAGASIPDVGPWYLLDGTKVFNNRANVLAGSPLAPLEITEQKTHVPFGDFAWTGHAIPQSDLSNDDCSAWTSSAPYAMNGPGGTIGDPHFTSQEWIIAQDRFAACSDLEHLYCLEE